MTTPMIDLMPASVRERTRAGARTRRVIAACVCVALLAGGAASWASLRLESLRGHHAEAQTLAGRALELEQQALRCHETARTIEQAVAEYQEVGFPVSVSSLVAGLSQTLPDGATLESLTLSLDDSLADQSESRTLRGGIAGFAASDEDVALLARRLSGKAPFTDVRLEYSRSRTVHGRGARGFAVSFEVDLDRRYVVLGPEDKADSAVASVQTVPKEAHQ
ncbi:MAG: PilN domain-containing protein [Phycisphaerales bacterium]|nr:PilN domain-containing protein [Phycisphaerales bacterium]